MSKRVPRAELLQMKGWKSPPSRAFEISQDRIDRFAETTEDRQFIHVDPERAGKTSFGGTIAHGFLTLALLPHLLQEISVAPEGMAMAVNYGLNKVRFIEPVLSGSRVRAHLEILDVVEKDENRLLVAAEVTVNLVEDAGSEPADPAPLASTARPVLVAETLTMFVTR